MNMKFIKKMLAVTLAATMMVAPAIAAGATDQAESSPAPAATVEVVNQPVMTIAGATIKSDVKGSYFIPKTSSIAGAVPRQSAATLKSGLGLASNEQAWVKAFVADAKTSPAAIASLNGAAAASGATLLGALNIDFGKMSASKGFSSLSADASVPMTFGVKNANGRTLEVAKVVPGGATTILPDTDDNPNTVTVAISGGRAAYGVIAH